MLIAQSTFPHVCQFYRAFRAGIHEPVAALWMKLRRCYDLRQLLHICRFDVNNVEALVLDV